MSENLMPGTGENNQPTDTSVDPANPETGAGNEGVEPKGNTEPNQPTELKEEPKSVVPEKYEFTAPEGKAFDSVALDKFSGLAKEAGLSNEVANKVVNEMSQVIEQRQQDAVAKVREDWTNASKSDTEFGGDKLNENLGIANKALTQFGSPELTKFLNETGIGNHPEVIRLFVKIGKSISEDGVVNGKPSDQPLSTTDILYPNMKRS